VASGESCREEQGGVYAVEIFASFQVVVNGVIPWKTGAHQKLFTTYGG
jgi:hypothetical protein